MRSMGPTNAQGVFSVRSWTKMARQDIEGMIWIGGRWWWFPGARIDGDSEFEWRDGLYLLESDGNIVEGIEVDDVIVSD
jgi:hypothetical protein